jgi:hypothetical protein
MPTQAVHWQLLRGQMLVAEFVPDRRSAIGAESTLAWTHSKTRIAAQIVEIGSALALDCRLELGAGDEFAFADQIAITIVRLDFRQSMPQHIEWRCQNGKPCTCAAILIGYGTVVQRFDRQIRRSTRHGHPKFGCNQINGFLRHQAIRGPLSANYADHPGDPIARFMIEQFVCARNITVAASVIFLIQWANPCPCSQSAHATHTGNEPFAFFQDQINLFRGNIVHIWIGNRYIGRSEHGNRMDRHDNVAVRWHLAAVHYRINDPMIHGDHCSLTGNDADAQTGKLCDLPCPGPGCVDDETGMDAYRFTASQIFAHCANNPVCHTLQFNNAVIR